MGNNLKALLALIYITTGSKPGHARVISLGNPKKAGDFEKHLQSKPNLTSLKSAYIDKEINQSQKILNSKYEIAVKGLLMADLKPSIFVFKEITSWKSKTLLSSESANIVLQSHMRLAHLDSQNSNFWLKHALFFNPDYKPQDGQFNPVVSKLLESRRKEITPYIYELNKDSISDNKTLVFVNGVQMMDSTKIHPSGDFKFTFIKSGFKKTTMDVRGEDITKLDKVKLKPLSLGTCKAPKFKKKYGIQIEKIYFSKDCIRSIQETQAQQLAKHQIETPNDFNNLKKPQEMAKPGTKKKNLFKKKSTWYIVGTAVATSILVATLSNRNSTTTVVPRDL